VLGLGWCLLNPLAMAVILASVFHSMFAADLATFVPFLLIGLALWGYWNTVVAQGCQCYFQGQAYLRQYPTPLSLFPMRTALASAVQLGCTLIMGALVAAVVVRPPAPFPLLTLLPSLCLTIGLGWAIATICGIVTVWLQDFEHLAQVGMQLLFYLTPVIYPPGTIRQGAVAWFLACNPLVPFFSLFRDPLLNGQFPAPATFLHAGLFTAASMLLAAVLLRRVRQTLIFRV